MSVFSEAAKRNELVAEHEILRELRCTAGEIELTIEFCPRPVMATIGPAFDQAASLGFAWKSAGGFTGFEGRAISFATRTALSRP